MPEMTSGAFWDETIYSPKNQSKSLTLPIKGNLSPNKYGSYSSLKPSFSVIMRGKTKNREQYYVVDIPRIESKKLQRSDRELFAYLEAKLKEDGVELCEITYSSLLKNQLVEFGGQRFYVVSSNELRNGTAPALKLKEYKRIEKCYFAKNADYIDALEIYDLLIELVSSKMPIYKEKLKLKEKRDSFSCLPNEQKKLVMIAILNSLNGRSVHSDMSKIGGSSRAERIRYSLSSQINKKSQEFYVIDQSVTGMFERRRRIGL